jgi:hypothetical protein
VQDFEDRVSEVLDTYGYVPYEDWMLYHVLHWIFTCFFDKQFNT